MPHIHDKIDFTVNPIVIHPDKKRVLLIYHPRYAKWIFIGGHIELDETPDQALLREVREECGLRVKVLADKAPFSDEWTEGLYRPRFIDIHNAQPPHKHIALSYPCLAESENFMMSDEHTDMGWFSLGDIKKLNLEDEYIYTYSKVALGEV